ncbi:MAG: beta-ketoacyl synthase chain length factor [Bacteroidales bacterium]|nr:beta-ketoacyl synthase chain length factor [Bacteroidales bacterium]
MDNNSIYINSFSQISVQEPLSENWTTNPIIYQNEKLVKIKDPDYKEYYPANIIRRNGKVLRRAMLVSQTALKNSELTQVDGVFTGSGLGCVENTEAFLQQIVYEGEEFLKPTYFMQSTHNTISSVIGIALNCKGYNSTYCHKGISFESALLDAYLQIKSGKINSGFVCGFDEMSNTYFSILERAGYLGGKSIGFAGESSAGCIISNKLTNNSLCKISSVRIGYTQKPEEIEKLLNQALYDSNLTINNIDLVMTGINGNPENDEAYTKNLEYLNIRCAKLGFAQLFGESYSGSVYGVYGSALCLKKSQVITPLKIDNKTSEKIENILIYRHFRNKDHAFIILQKC